LHHQRLIRALELESPGRFILFWAYRDALA
jgi:hypothetical protein